MLSNKKKEEAHATKGVNLIGEGTRIEGDISAAGDIRIDGLLKGDLTTLARVVIGLNGSVEGQVKCTFAEVIGQLKGDIQATEALCLRSTARISGNLTVGRLLVESGAVFSGSCSMSGQIKPLQTNEKTNSVENAQTA
jgi:cytoskeletal protein CcmA (bactofilin family)